MFKNFQFNKVFPLFLLLWGSSCQQVQKYEASRAIAVDITEVRTIPAVYDDDYPATVIALNQVELRADISGYVTGIYFQDGQVVHQGQKLYEIDRQQYQASYEQAQADLKVSEINLSRARQDAERYEELASRDAIAKQILDHARSDLQSAESQVTAAQANVTRVATDLRYSTIRAPFTGLIGISQVKLGTLVTPGQTLLNTISSVDPIGVDFSIGEQQIDRFNQFLEQAKQAQKDSTFRLALPDGTIYSPEGKILLMDRAVNPQTGTIMIRLLFPNPLGALKDGLTCDVLVRNRVPGMAIAIPQKAQVDQMGESFVYVVHSGQVFLTRIQTGRTIGNQVLVKSGIQTGDTIVTDGVQKLHDRAQIVVSSPSRRQ